MLEDTTQCLGIQGNTWEMLCYLIGIDNQLINAVSIVQKFQCYHKLNCRSNGVGDELVQTAHRWLGNTSECLGMAWRHLGRLGDDWKSLVLAVYGWRILGVAWGLLGDA